MTDDLTDLANLPYKDAADAAPNIDHAGATADPHVEQICNCVDRLNRRLGL